MLNYGHTFAHAYETCAGYGTLLHGEAVAIGMTDAARLAQKLGLVGEDFVQRQSKLLEAIWLRTAPDAEFRTDDLISVMKRDKKAVGGQIKWVLLEGIGKARIVSQKEIDTPTLKRSLRAGLRPLK